MDLKNKGLNYMKEASQSNAICKPCFNSDINKPINTDTFEVNQENLNKDHELNIKELFLFLIIMPWYTVMIFKSPYILIELWKDKIIYLTFKKKLQKKLSPG